MLLNVKAIQQNLKNSVRRKHGYCCVDDFPIACPEQLAQKVAFSSFRSRDQQGKHILTKNEEITNPKVHLPIHYLLQPFPVQTVTE